MPNTVAIAKILEYIDGLKLRVNALEEWQQHVNNGDAMDLMNLQKTDNDLKDGLKLVEDLPRAHQELAFGVQELRNKVKALEDEVPQCLRLANYYVLQEKVLKLEEMLAKAAQWCISQELFRQKLNDRVKALEECQPKS